MSFIGYENLNNDNSNGLYVFPDSTSIVSNIGGIGLSAQTDISIAAGSTYVVSITGNLIPNNDNSYKCGQSGRRWTQIWAVNGTIQTSDEREKNTIIDSDLGLDFINKLRPVSFKWNVGENVVTEEEDGFDEKGKKKFKKIVTPKEGIRTHYGFIAQEVEAILNGKDFGGFIHDTDTDIKGLRYDQFTPIITKSIQEIVVKYDNKIQELEAKIDELKNKLNEYYS